MTNEEKQLLLKDLCERLPYGVMVENILNHKIFDLSKYLYCLPVAIENFKPYLRPMSSMTEEERKEYNGFIFSHHHEWDGSGTYTEYVEVSEIDKFRDWLNAHYFDYRGLIPMGLALEAKEGMYD